MKNAFRVLSLTLVLLATGNCAAQTPAGVPEAEVTPLADRDAIEAGEEFRLALQVSLPENVHVNSNQPRDPLLIPVVLTVAPPPGVSVLEIIYPEATDLEQVGVDEPLAVYENEFTVGVRLETAADLALDELTVPASFRYQACDERVCYFPATVQTAWSVPVAPRGTATVALNSALFEAIAFGTGAAPPENVVLADDTTSGIAGTDEDLIAQLEGFTLLGSTGGYLGRDRFLTFISDAEAGVQERGLFEDRGVAAIVVLVLLGGLALNLTPCVLPMIPINLAVIGAGAQASSRRRGFLLGTTYGAAMAVVYGLLGLVVILTAGTFGTINASPWFNTAIAVVFVVLGLAMFDVFMIDFSRFSARVNFGGVNRGSFALAFGMGAIAALLAGACVAPVVIQVIVFSGNMYTAGTAAALVLPFLLGIGMALPWPIAGAGISALPKPGPWMVHVKHAFGVIILGTAVYYGFVGYTLFADRWVDPGEVSASVDRMIEEGWHPSLADGLAEARTENKLALIDLWATWCKNCLTMDRTTLQDAGVTDALSDYVKIKFQAEDPSESQTRDVMAHLGAIGLPTYVILRPND